MGCQGTDTFFKIQYFEVESGKFAYPMGDCNMASAA